MDTPINSQPARPRSPGRVEQLLWLAIILACLLAAGEKAATLAVGADELEHLHATWLWSNGVSPYVGFFEHHPPAYWIMQRPVVALFSAGRHLYTLLLADRAFAGLFVAGTVVAAWWLFRRLFQPAVGWFGAGLWAFYCATDADALYARPDMPMLLLLICGVALTLEGLGLAIGSQPAHSRLRAFFGGLLIGGAVCVQTKAVFWLLPLAAILTGLVLYRAIRRDDRGGLLTLAASLSGVALPLLLLVGWVACCNDFSQFWFCNVTVNRVIPGKLLSNPAAMRLAILGAVGDSGGSLLAAMGAVCCVLRHEAGVEKWPRLLVLAGLALGGIALIVLAGAPLGNYRLPFALISAGLAGAAVAEIAERFGPWGGRAVGGAALLVIVGLLATHRLGDQGPRLDASLEPYQFVLDKAEPTDTCLILTNLNPVLIRDTDPKMFLHLRFAHEPDDCRWVTAVMQTFKPRFVVGFGTYIWDGKGGAMQVQCDPAMLETYEPARPTVLVRRPAAEGDAGAAAEDAGRTRQVAEAYYRGNLHVSKGDWAGAIPAFDQAIALNPRFAEAYNARGDAFASQGDLALAVADYSEAVRLNPRYARAFCNLANAYRDGGNFEAAIANYTKAIELDPNRPAAYGNRAVVFFYKKDYGRAWSDVKRCQELGGTLAPEFLADLRKASGQKP